MDTASAHADSKMFPHCAGDYLLECGLQTPELGADTVAGIYATSFKLVAAQPPPSSKPPPKRTPPLPPKQTFPPPPKQKPPPPPPRPATPAS